MKIAGCFVVLAVGLFGIAKADTPSQVWNGTVAMSIPGGAPNPLQGQVYKNFGKAQTAVPGAHADAVFLVQKEQTIGSLGANILTRRQRKTLQLGSDYSELGSYGHENDLGRTRQPL